jgi:hypothetical protein
VPCPGSRHPNGTLYRMAPGSGHQELPWQPEWAKAIAAEREAWREAMDRPAARHRSKARRDRTSVSAVGKGYLPPTAALIRDGIPIGRQDAWLTKLAARLARFGKAEDEIAQTLMAVIVKSDQDERDPWTPGQLRAKARSGIEFIARQDDSRPGGPSDKPASFRTGEHGEQGR